MDTSGNRKIDAAEFRSYVTRLGFQAHPMTVDAVFTVIDRDRSGEISHKVNREP